MKPKTFRIFKKTYELEDSGELAAGIQPYYNRAHVQVVFDYSEPADNELKEILEEAIRKALHETFLVF